MDIRPSISATSCTTAFLFGTIAAAQSVAPPPVDVPAVLATVAPTQNPGEKQPAISAPTLLEDLQSSFIWSENAKSLAELFATKADSEGFLNAGSFFRAATRSLNILAAQYSESVKKLGGTPAAKADELPPVVKTTKENLQVFSNLLTTRRTGALSDASTRHRTGPNREATKTLHYEREALTELARFSSDAAESLDKLKGAKKDFFISRPCGFVTDKLVASKCPVCKTGKDQFEKIN